MIRIKDVACLGILREMDEDSVDLAYIDPPYNTKHARRGMRHGRSAIGINQQVEAVRIARSSCDGILRVYDSASWLLWYIIPICIGRRGVQGGYTRSRSKPWCSQPVQAVRSAPTKRSGETDQGDRQLPHPGSRAGNPQQS